jgi:cold shock CspA family protein
MMLRGSVKFFDETKGWGFIVPEEPGADFMSTGKAAKIGETLKPLVAGEQHAEEQG